MNTNETNSVRLKRIQAICRSLKIMLLLYMGFVIGFLPSVFHFFHKTPESYWAIFGRTYATLAEVPWQEKLLVALCLGILFVAVVTGYQLLNLYQRGVIFSDKNVQLLRRIGWLTASYGTVTILGDALFLVWGNWIHSAYGHLFGALAYGFFALLSSPWVVGGVCVLVLSLIMDEGRKIQEEQELTV